jgi:hypothetical protein
MDVLASTLTDDFEPTKALDRLTEKMFSEGEYRACPPELERGVDDA